jgi:phosphoserine phosphatase
MQIRILSDNELPMAVVMTALAECGARPGPQVVMPEVAGACRCAVIDLDDLADPDAVRACCHRLSDEQGCDVVALPRAAVPPRLAVFDLDSTLVRCEGIDELAKRAGAGERVAAITEAAMRGEIDFAESFQQRIATLAGLPAAVFEEIAAQLPFGQGLEVLVSALRRHGCRLVIASGGFRPLAAATADRFGFDEYHANVLEVAAGAFTGRHQGEIVTGEVKARLLREIAEREAIPREAILAVGDGANDLAMLAEAGLGIAYHAKPIVRERAGVGLAHVGLDGVAWLTGALDPLRV